MTAPSSPAPGFVLVIERGQTRFPRRPLDADRFLIGAGSNCHLQLGGDMPILHSIIVPEGDHLWIDAVVPTPPLMVNGQQFRDGEIRAGDVIEIGSFVFCIAVASATATSTPAVAPAAARTAEELVDALAAELGVMSAAQTARQRGAASLLEAAALSGQNSAPDHRSSVLQTLLAELRTRAASLDQRESQLDEQARQLAETQSQMQQQLDKICQQLQSPAASGEIAPLRMTA